MADGPVARPRGAAGRRRPPQRPARSLVRTVEPDVRDHEPGVGDGKLQARAAVSDAVSTDSKAGGPSADAGDDVRRRPGVDGHEYRLFRAYAFTDRDCVNACSAARSSAGRRSRRASPARSSFPTNQEELDAALAGILPSAKSETAKTYMADGTPVTANETLGADDRVRVDLPDVDTTTTRYFWTVVPVGIIVDERRDVHVLRRRVAAGRVRVGPHRELRQGVAAGDHDGGDAVRVRSHAERPPARAGRPAPGRLLDAARRVAAGRRRDRVRGAVVARRSTRGERAARRARTPPRPCSSSPPAAGTTASAG